MTKYQSVKLIRLMQNGLLTGTLLHKIYNSLLNRCEIAAHKKYLRSKPLSGIFSPASTCNYRCKFCESDSQLKSVHTRFANTISAKDFSALDFFGKHTWSVSFFGNIGEPLLNREFTEIAHGLKKKGIYLSVNTNGSLLSQEVSQKLVRMGFDDILVSFHAGKKQTYDFLQNKSFNLVCDNISYLTSIKKQYPRVFFNFALNKINGPEISEFVALCKKLQIDGISANHYYHTRNAFENDISYWDQPQYGNQLIDKIYELGRSQGLLVLPEKRNYLRTSDNMDGQIGKKRRKTRQKKSFFCPLPFQYLNFYGSFSERDVYDVRVCNRFFLFKLNYREFMGQDMNIIWNHPILQYLRKTSGNNAVCRFCRNKGIKRLRNLNNKEYRKKRDASVRDFFEEAWKHSNANKKIRGLTVLKENVYEGE